MLLGVNIDHIATVRNARGTTYPSPVEAALVAETHGADLITMHLREDRRHIKDADVSFLWIFRRPADEKGRLKKLNAETELLELLQNLSGFNAFGQEVVNQQARDF